MASENTRKWAIIPEPNSMTVGEGTVLLPYAGRVNESIAIGDGDFLLAHQLVADIRSATGTDWDIATGDMWSGFIRLRIADSRDFDSQDGGTAGAYTLTINTDGITITGCDSEGVRNGVQTLRQLIRQNGAVLPELQIADAPHAKSGDIIWTRRAAACQRSHGSNSGPTNSASTNTTNCSSTSSIRSHSTA